MSKKRGGRGPDIPEVLTMTSGQMSARILLVDDIQTHLKIATTMLLRMGCVVDTANDGRQALLKFVKKDYDLIFMDCMMPVMDGYEATEAIREWELKEGGRVPIVALTANATTYNRPKCLDAGMDDFITKPAAAEQLYLMLRRWVGNVMSMSA